VAEVLALRPLTEALVARLNPEVDLASVAGDVAKIGYGPAAALTTGLAADLAADLVTE
jgi:hypothetical protein